MTTTQVMIFNKADYAAAKAAVLELVARNVPFRYATVGVCNTITVSEEDVKYAIDAIHLRG